MASKPPRLAIVLSGTARRDLNEIWTWNAEKRSLSQAETYEDFLLAHIQNLETDYPKGQVVPTAPEFLYITARKSRRGHGHLVIYEIREDRVVILRLYHTRQDWQNRFLEDR